MLRLSAKSLFSCIALIGLLVLPIESQAVFAPSVYVPVVVPSPATCVTVLNETGVPGQMMTDFNPQVSISSINSGGTGPNRPPQGILCPGKYNISARCYVNATSGCGGSSCGWSIDLYVMNIGNQATQDVASSSKHDGCAASHGNYCENNSDDMYTSTGTYDTNTQSTPYVSPWIEDGSVTACNITASQTTAY